MPFEGHVLSILKISEPVFCIFTITNKVKMNNYGFVDAKIGWFTLPLCYIRVIACPIIC